MSNATQKDELLGYLTEELGCIYISDLRSSKVTNKSISLALEKICPGAFSLKAWRDAASYLLQASELPDTEAEVRELLRKALIKK